MPISASTILRCILPAVAAGALLVPPARGESPSATELVERAFRAYQGKASVGTMAITIHLPSAPMPRKHCSARFRFGLADASVMISE